VRAGWAISKHRTTGQHRKVGFQPNIGLGFKYKNQILTDLGIKAPLYIQYLFVKSRFSTFELSNLKLYKDS
jgi:hypothetical protein